MTARKISRKDSTSLTQQAPGIFQNRQPGAERREVYIVDPAELHAQESRGALHHLSGLRLVAEHRPEQRVRTVEIERAEHREALGFGQNVAARQYIDLGGSVQVFHEFAPQERQPGELIAKNLVCGGRGDVYQRLETEFVVRLVPGVAGIVA
jgi:hypothetical protein